MPLRSQKQVMVHLDRMNGKAMRRVRKDYVRKTIGPLVAAIRDAASGQQALGQLGAAMLRRMDSTDLEGVVANAGVQIGLIGRASALPRGSDQVGRLKSEDGKRKTGPQSE